MLWLLTFATVEDLSAVAEVPAGPTTAGPLFWADSSGTEFVSGAVIAFSAQFYFTSSSHFMVALCMDR
jgi:hypothetical protein